LTVAATAAGDDSSAPPPHYLLCSSSQVAMLLHSPLRTPHMPRCINLVLVSAVEASPTMAGLGDDPETDSVKLDHILA
jgi:hypothetical protein